MMMRSSLICLFALLASHGASSFEPRTSKLIVIVGSSQDPLSIRSQNGVIGLNRGHSLNLTCLIDPDVTREFHLNWHVLGFIKGIQHDKGFNRLSILFDEVNLNHTGEYQCTAKGVLVDSVGEETISHVIKLLVMDNASQDNCPVGNFQCSSGSCIPKIHLCDGLPDCPEFEDEDVQACGLDPCRFKMNCPDRRCVLCCNPSVDANCNYVPKCCKAFVDFHRNVKDMDMQFVQVPEDDSHFQSNILTIIACSTVCLIVFGFMFALGIYHNCNSAWSASQFRRHTQNQHHVPRVRNTYYISNRVQTTLERPPLHRPPSYRTIFGTEEPPPPYSEEFSESHPFDLNNNNNSEHYNNDSNNNHTINHGDRLQEGLLGGEGSSSSLSSSSLRTSRESSSEATTTIQQY